MFFFPQQLLQPDEADWPSSSDDSEAMAKGKKI